LFSRQVKRQRASPIAELRQADIWPNNWLSNRIFQSYADIVALCCEAWNKLIERPWKITSIGMREWANGF